MNFLNLEYFVKVAEYKEIHTAAKELYITDQALSKTIKKLEDELSCELFERSRPLVLTSAGRIVYENSVTILKQRDHMLTELSSVNCKKVIRLSMLSFGVPSFLNEMIIAFQRECPQTELELSMRQTTDLRRADVADLYFNPGMHVEGFHDEILIEDKLCVMVAEELVRQVYKEKTDDVIAQMEKAGDINILGKLPFVQCDEYFWKFLGDNVTVKPKLLTQISNSSLNSDMCLNGLKATLMPYNEALHMIHQNTNDRKIFAFPLTMRGGEFFFSISYEEGKVLSAEEKKLIEMSKEYLMKGTR